MDATIWTVIGMGVTILIAIAAQSRQQGRAIVRLQDRMDGLRVVELQEVTFSGQRSTGLIDDMRIAVIPSRHHGADAGGYAPAG